MILFTSRRDAYDFMNRELGSGRFTDTCRLGLLADIAFPEKFRVLGSEKPRTENGAVDWLSQGV